MSNRANGASTYASVAAVLAEQRATGALPQQVIRTSSISSVEEVAASLIRGASTVSVARDQVEVAVDATAMPLSPLVPDGAPAASRPRAGSVRNSESGGESRSDSGDDLAFGGWWGLEEDDEAMDAYPEAAARADGGGVEADEQEAAMHAAAALWLDSDAAAHAGPAEFAEESVGLAGSWAESFITDTDHSMESDTAALASPTAPFVTAELRAVTEEQLADEAHPPDLAALLSGAAAPHGLPGGVAAGARAGGFPAAAATDTNGGADLPQETGAAGAAGAAAAASDDGSESWGEDDSDDDMLVGTFDGAGHQEGVETVVPLVGDVRRYAQFGAGGYTIFIAARCGDVERVRMLVEIDGVSPNERDEWDCTALYYSSLCGHLDTVKFLLSKGARCEQNTFDGERVYYAALNDEIRALLREFRAVPRQQGPLFQFLYRVFDAPSTYADVCFVVGGATRPSGAPERRLYCHKAILSARSPYFRRQFATRWRGRAVIQLRDARVDATALEALLRMLYSEVLSVPAALATATARLAKQCRMWGVREALNAAAAESDGTGTITIDFGEGSDYATCQTESLREGLRAVLRGVVLPASLRHRGRSGSADSMTAVDEEGRDGGGGWRGEGGSSSTTSAAVADVGAVDAEEFHYDVVFNVGGLPFRCHRAILCNRCEYFDTMLRCGFREGLLARRVYDARQQAAESPTAVGDGSGAPPPPQLAPTLELSGISPRAFAIVLSFIYTDDLVRFNDAAMVEATYLADLLLLPELRNLLATYLSARVRRRNFVELTRLANLLAIPRIVEACARFAALDFDWVAQQPAFADMVVRDAAAIKKRETADSVPLLDDIRAQIRVIYDVSEADLGFAALPGASGGDAPIHGCPERGASAADDKVREARGRLAAVDNFARALNITARRT